MSAQTWLRNADIFVPQGLVDARQELKGYVREAVGVLKNVTAMWVRLLWSPRILHSTYEKRSRAA